MVANSVLLFAEKSPKMEFATIKKLEDFHLPKWQYWVSTWVSTQRYTIISASWYDIHTKCDMLNRSVRAEPQIKLTDSGLRPNDGSIWTFAIDNRCFGQIPRCLIRCFVLLCSRTYRIIKFVSCHFLKEFYMIRKTVGYCLEVLQIYTKFKP